MFSRRPEAPRGLLEPSGQLAALAGWELVEPGRVRVRAYPFVLSPRAISLRLEPSGAQFHGKNRRQRLKTSLVRLPGAEACVILPHLIREKKPNTCFKAIYSHPVP